VTAMRDAADLAACARRALIDRRVADLPAMIDANFDIRRRIYKLPAWQIEMVETARRIGASANFAGSGGAVVGTYGADPQRLDALRAAFKRIECTVVQPR